MPSELPGVCGHWHDLRLKENEIQRAWEREGEREEVGNGRTKNQLVQNEVGFFVLFCFVLFWPRHVACGISVVPQPAIEPAPPAVEAQRQTLNHQGSPPNEVFLVIEKC